ncbi:MAG: hypothetical protein ACKPEQ_24690, partial [Dolichospermum sp.]
MNYSYAIFRVVGWVERQRNPTFPKITSTKFAKNKNKINKRTTKFLSLISVYQNIVKRCNYITCKMINEKNKYFSSHIIIR